MERGPDAAPSGSEASCKLRRGGKMERVQADWGRHNLLWATTEREGAGVHVDVFGLRV